MPEWNAEQYLKFEKERSRAARDLIGSLENGRPARVLDVGCGPGNSTALLAERFPDARVLGIDSSAAMLEAARKAHPALEFRLCDAGRELGRLEGGFDLVFSNACIHWIPGQDELLRNMMGLLAPGGELAVQIPLTGRAPLYQILPDAAMDPRWASYLAGVGQSFHSLEPEGYFDLLADLTDDFSIWETTYLHRLGGRGEVLEWYGGTGLRPYLQALPAELREPFAKELYRRLEGCYAPRRGGQVIFRIARLFMTARK